MVEIRVAVTDAGRVHGGRAERPIHSAARATVAWRRDLQSPAQGAAVDLPVGIALIEGATALVLR
jgi:hypothetical protein